MTQFRPEALEQLLHHYTLNFTAQNHAARIVARGLSLIGVGIRPLIDHFTFRTLDVENRAQEFLKHGYEYDADTGLIQGGHSWTKLYIKSGYPSIFLEQAFEGKKGQGSMIREWVGSFGEEMPYHLAVRVEDMDEALISLEKQGISFVRPVMGNPGSSLRQISATPEIKERKPFTSLVLVERHGDYSGFIMPDLFAR